MKKKTEIIRDFGELVYSTNPDFASVEKKEDMEETLSPSSQNLRIHTERKNRKGKTVTIISGFCGSEDDLKDLEKRLKIHCGTGGSAKDGEIIIQGDQREKVALYLKSNAYNVK